MQKYFSKAQGISKFTRLSSIFITIGALNSSSIAYADVNGIPFNPDFPKAEYPYVQAPDACSGVTDGPNSNREIRDTWGPVDFRGACNTHDKCYYTVGSKWNTCNERFYSDLRAACERDLKISFNVPAPTLTDPFRTRRVDGPPDPVRLSACYTIASSYYVGVQGGVALGVFDKAQDKQTRYKSWVASLKTSSGAFVKLRNKNWGRCLNLQNATQNGVNTNVWECVSHPDQEWKIEDAGNGFVKLRNKNWGRCLNLQNATQNGVNTNVWECVLHPDQEWKIENAG